MGVPTFVVGTGRCGSTMISNMLRDHPDVLSISEFFSLVTDGSRTSEPFSGRPLDGRQFWTIIAAITPFISFQLRQQRRRPVELLYPYDAPRARYSLQTGVPALLLITLPHLADDPHRLFDLLQAEVRAWPVAPISHHYRRLFGWLAELFGKRLWVERSGASLGRIGQLLGLFPEARFIHIVRDGRDVALSMRADKGFRIAYVTNAIAQHLGMDPIGSADRTFVDRVPAELRPFLPERFDPDALDAFDIPVPSCGAS